MLWVQMFVKGLTKEGKLDDGGCSVGDEKMMQSGGEL